MAIARDNFTNGSFASGTSRTFSHTCSGTDRFLFVHTFINTTVDRITGVTYAGTPMTLLRKLSPGADRYLYVFYLTNPASGANNVVISASTSTAIGGNAASYTGVEQTTQPEADGQAISTGASLDTTLTTVTDNAWTVLCVLGNNADSTASTGSSLFGQNSIYTDADFYDSSQGTAGSKTMTVNSTGAAPLGRIIASIAPAGGGGGGYRFNPQIKPFAGL